MAEEIYEELQREGMDVIYDDRDASPGEKFADAELLGCPLRLTVGRKGLENGEVEAQVRRGQDKRSLPLEGAAHAAVELWRTLPVKRAASRSSRAWTARTVRRPETRKGQPLRPWTIPNCISYVRLALLPVFVVIALNTDDGRSSRRRCCTSASPGATSWTAWRRA